MKYVSVDTFSNNAVSKNFLSWNVERAHNRKCFDFFWRLFHVCCTIYNCFLANWFCVKRFYFWHTFFRVWYFIFMYIWIKDKPILEIIQFIRRNQVYFSSTFPQFEIALFEPSYFFNESLTISVSNYICNRYLLKSIAICQKLVIAVTRI